MAAFDVDALIKAVIDNGQDQFYSFGREFGLTPAQISSITYDKPSTSDKLRAIIDKRRAVVGDEKLRDDLLTACDSVDISITGVVLDQLKSRGEISESLSYRSPRNSKSTGYVATCPFPREIQRCEGCVGREAELQQLRQAFTCKRTPDKPAVQVVQVVTGPGGMGKTRLIFEYALRHHDDYRHGIYYFFMQSLSTFYDSVRCNLIIVGIEPSGIIKDDIIRFEGYVRHFPNCLFLYDNLEEPTLSSCLPSLSIPVDILVATRRLQHFSGSILNLQLPSTDNAIEILCKGFSFLNTYNPTDLKGSDLEYAKKIVGAGGVDRLPLALHHISAFVKEDSNDVTMKELWESIEMNRSSISLDPRSLEEWLQHYALKSLIPYLASSLGVSSLDNLRSLSHSAIETSSLRSADKELLVKAKEDLLQRPSVGPWRLDIEQVCSKSRVCLDILAIASLLRSQGIHVSLIELCEENISESKISRLKFDSDLRQIEKFSLITYSRSVSQETTISIHPFIQDTVRQCVVPAAELVRYLSIVCEVLLRLLPSLDDIQMERGLTTTSVLRYSSDLYHVARIHVESADEQKTWRDVLDLGCVLAIRLEHTAIAKSLCQKRLSLEKDPRSLLRPLVLGVTAMAYSLDKSKECHDLIDEALILLKDDPLVGNKKEVEQWALAMNSVCSACVEVNNFEKSEVCLKRLVAVLEREKMTECVMYADALNELAVAYDFKGAVSRAEQLSRKALKYYYQLSPPSYVKIGRELDNLANYCLPLGRLEEAEKLVNDAIGLLKDNLPSNHPSSIRSIISLGKVNIQSGRYQKAETELKKAWSMVESAFLTEHPIASYALHELAACSSCSENYEDAETYLRRAVDVTRKELRDDNIDTIGRLCALAGCLNDQGKYLEGEQLLRSLLDSIVQRLGERHIISANALQYLGVCLHQQNKLEEAEDCLQKALDIKHERLDYEGISSAQTLESLGFCLWVQDKNEESEHCLQRSLELTKTAVGEDNFSLWTNFTKLGRCFQSQQKYEDAELNFSKAIDITIRNLERPEIAASVLHLLGVCLWEQGKYEECEQHLQRSLVMKKSALGEDNIKLADTFMYLGFTFESQKKYADSENSFRKALHINIRNSVPSEITARAWFHLGDCLLLQNKRVATVKALKIAIHANKQAQGQVSVTTHHMLYMLGKSLFEIYKYKDAQEALEDALARQREIEPRSVALARTLHYLASCLKFDGNYRVAYNYLYEAKDIMIEKVGQEDAETQAVIVSLMSLRRNYETTLFTRHSDV